MPSGPSSSASACSGVLTMNGKSISPNSFTMPTREVVAGDCISCVPPRSADCCCISLPSWFAGYSRTLSLPPLFAATISVNLFTPMLTG